MRNHKSAIHRVSRIASLLGVMLLTGCLATVPALTGEQVRQANATSDRNLIARMQAAEQARLRAEELARIEAARMAAPKTAPELQDALRVGLYQCDLQRQVELVSVQSDRQGARLRWNMELFDMVAVQANTGAVRLENQQSGLVWISIVGKSMLLDTQNGKQLANECNLTNAPSTAS